MKNLKKKIMGKAKGGWKEYDEVFSPARRAALEETGTCILEGKREGAFVYGEDGKKYIDCISGAGIYNLGRSPAGAAEMFTRELDNTDQGNFVFVSREKARLAEMLVSFVPARLEGCFFSVARGEAMDFACKLARGYTGRTEYVTVDGGSYGQTGFALSLSERDDRCFYGDLIPGVRKIPFGNIPALEAAVSKKTAAIIAEPLQAENGCRSAGSDYFTLMRKLCTRSGALLVLDETQTGMGRTGRKFSFEYLGIEPDVLVIGEALGAGMFPIAATMFNRKIQSFMNKHPLIHLSTFGGHDLGCMVACAALESYESMSPWKNAAHLGSELMKGLEIIRGAKPGIIRSIRGMGLLVSINADSDASAAALCRGLMKEGVLATRGDVAKYSVVLRPPLIITQNEVRAILKAVERTISRM